MASLRTQRSKKTGLVTYTVLFRHDGRQTSETFDTADEAADFQELIEDLGVQGAVDLLNASSKDRKASPKLSAWCHKYIENLTGVQEGTRRRYRSYADKHLGKLANLRLSNVSPTAIAAWVNAMEKDELSGKTIALRHGFVSGALKAAVRAQVITSNPCEGTRLPRTERDEMVFLTPDEFAILLTYVRPDSQDLVACLPSTGLRWGEITALQARDVDIEHKTLTITRAWKWSDDGVARVGPPKSKKSRRTIGLPDQVVEILKRRIKGLGPAEYIFTKPDGKPWTAPAFHSAVWQPAVRNARGEIYKRHTAPAADKPARLRKDGQPWGARQHTQRLAPEGQRLTKRPRIHDMRHTCAAWLIKAKVPLAVIQRHLGHESIQTTVDRYGHIELAQMQAVGAALSGALVLALPQIES